ncbi:unnamed protein product [Polarella glacialis]|uniref:Uncharacterized protein n=1 Tax=Polarella glacialis TaxID=89957 RepID=A0A813FHT8_POLGL|nr:unnamed protein product [Polarella glacialis]
MAPPLPLPPLSVTASAIYVEGCGTPGVDGIYARTGQKVRGADVFQKAGTELALLKHWEDLAWVLADLSGKTLTGSRKGSSQTSYQPTKCSELVSKSLPWSKQRYRPQAMELYRVVPQFGDRPLPPEIGWYAVDGQLPPPVIVRPFAQTTNPQHFLLGKVPGSKMAMTALKFQKSSSEPTLPPLRPEEQGAAASAAKALILDPFEDLHFRDAGGGVLRWSSKEAGVSQGDVPGVTPGMHSLALPWYPSQIPRRSLSASKTAASPRPASSPHIDTLRQEEEYNESKAPRGYSDSLFNFSVLLSRPSHHTSWGIIFLDSIFKSHGYRIVQEIEKGSPADRWNVWQGVRGRPELFIKKGDQLLLSDGHWATREREIESSEGFEHFPELPAGGYDRPHGEGSAKVVLQFGRRGKRPTPPNPPWLESWERGSGLRVEWDASFAGSPKINVTAWAVILREEVPTGVLSPDAPGRPRSVWYVYDSLRGKVKPVVRGTEVGSVTADSPEEGITLHISEGLKTGRSYRASLSMLTKHGWSAFSNLSQSVFIHKTSGIIRDLQDVAFGPQEGDDKWEQIGQTFELKRLTRVGAPLPHVFVLPRDLKPVYSTPISTDSSDGKICELLGKRRLLMLQLVLLGGRPKNLRVSATEGGSMLVVEDPGVMKDVDAARTRTVKLHDMAVKWALWEGDFILRINGITGARAMVEEIERDPNILALEVARAAGGKFEEESSVFPLDLDLDGDMIKNCEEIRACGIVHGLDAKLTMALVGTSKEELELLTSEGRQLEQDFLLHMQSATHKRGTSGNPLLEMCERRLLVLRRLADAEAREVDASKPDTPQACRALAFALADCNSNPAVLGDAIQLFIRRLGVVNIRAERAVSLFLRRANAVQHLWAWRYRLRDIRLDLLQATPELVRLTSIDPKLRDNDIKAETFKVLHLLARKVGQGKKDFAQELGFHLHEAEAVRRRYLDNEGEDAYDPSKKDGWKPRVTIALGETLGWW